MSSLVWQDCVINVFFKCYYVLILSCRTTELLLFITLLIIAFMVQLASLPYEGGAVVVAAPVGGGGGAPAAAAMRSQRKKRKCNIFLLVLMISGELITDCNSDFYSFD